MHSNLINTPRLELRLWNLSDTDALLSLCRANGFDDFSTGRFQNMDKDKAKSFILEEQKVFLKHGFARLGVFLRSSRFAVGMCGLYLMSDTNFLDTIGIAYRFSKENWGQGYAPEAANGLIQYGFKSLNLKSVSAIIDPNNLRSRRVVEKIEMKLLNTITYKGELRQHWIRSSI